MPTVATPLEGSAMPDINAALEGTSAREVVMWAVDTFGDGLVLASSLSNCVLIDVATQVAPQLEVAFLDTQYHFPETLAYLEEIRRRFDLNLRVIRPRVEPDELWRSDTDTCCLARKVEPLNRALAGKRAWMTGLRRQESPDRSATPVVSWDARRGLVKVNPLAAWTDEEVRFYIRERGLPEHPLTAKGYPSIGCWPCTSPVKPGEDPRSGRWKGTAKTECGLHL